MEIKTIEAISKIMAENGLTSFELEEKGIKLKLERKQEFVTASPVNITAPAVPQAVNTVSETTAEPAEKLNEVKSPTVGVFYTSPSPDSDAYVRVGSQVKKGDVLCIIEAMKLMNEITSEFDGEIVEICAGNGQVVEYGQPLFRVRS